ncbi:MAG: Selenide, water dikinase [Thermoanaerobacterales bacterium 50_218]|nr:MAG: Selenide, water dikinase [Thermoanaerobacterales bacterium 50_218]
MGCALPDDAGVFRIGEELALVQTVDFFTPVVDDPYQFGQVAAANALSDVYAMGGKPLTALNIVAFPTCTLGIEVLREIVRGGCDKVAEAGAVVLGGHSIEDSEPKYGLAVTGIVHPDKVVTNSGAQPGDYLILTKPLGTGVLATALKAGMLEPEDEKVFVEVMATLNAAAAKAMTHIGVSACTDITGFGLLGHLREMACNSKVDAEVWVSQVPFLPRVLEFASMGILPGGAYANKEHVTPFVEFAEEIPEAEKDLLYDPQTSGGLLIAVPEDRKEALEGELRNQGVASYRVIGRVVGEGKGKIVVRRESK